MNTLITGSSGFVGRNLINYLKINSKINVKILDLRKNENEVFNAGSIIHLAGKAHDLKNIANDAEYFKVNTELTKKLFDQFLKSDCKTFIYISSVKAVRDIVEGVLTED